MTPRQLLDLLAMPLAIARPTSPLPMLQHLHIDDEQVTATNGESTVRVDLRGHEALQGLSCCVEARRLQLVLGTLRPTDSVTIRHRDNTMTLQCAGSRRTLQTLPAEDFPLPAPIDESALRPVPKPRALADAIRFLQPAIRMDEVARIMLRGINAVRGALCASNGIAGHMIEGAGAAAGIGDGMIIPGTALPHLLTLAEAAADETDKAMLAGAASDSDGDAARAYVAQFGRWLLQFKLIGGGVLPMDRVVPRVHSGTTFTINRRAFASACRNMERLALGKKAPLLLLTLRPRAGGSDADLRLELESGRAAGEEAADNLVVESGAKEEWVCGLNPVFTANALDAINGETVTCSQANDKAPFFITGCDPAERCVIQPMRM